MCKTKLKGVKLVLGVKTCMKVVVSSEACLLHVTVQYICADDFMLFISDLSIQKSR